MKQFFSFVRKEFYHVFRDRKTMLLLFGMPIAQILLFGFALTNEIKNTKIVVCDYAHDPMSEQVIAKLEASKSFDVVKQLMSATEIEAAFKADNIKLAIVFPNQLYQELNHNNKATIQIIADGSDPNTATTVTNYATSIIQSYMRDKFPQPDLLQINTEVRMIYNPELKGTTNFVPGVMALVLMLISVLMTSVSIVKEKESGTMEVLLVSPFSALMVVISKAVPYLVLSFVNLIIILLLSVFLLDVPINGSLPLIVFESLLLIITALSLGLMISNITNSQQEAMIVSLMGMLLPVMIFTGFMFPIENMPKPLQIISNIIPSKWYYTIIKAVMIKGVGFSGVWKETLVLLGMTLFLLTVSIKKFKTRLG